MYDETRGWGTVCDSNWGTQEAVVVCRQLDFPFATSQGISNSDAANSEPHFGRGSGPVWLTDLGCGGFEPGLDACPHKGWGNSDDCDHGRDAGVICNGTYKW